MIGGLCAVTWHDAGSPAGSDAGALVAAGR
jgi:hypothetical protein